MCLSSCRACEHAAWVQCSTTNHCAIAASRLLWHSRDPGVPACYVMFACVGGARQVTGTPGWRLCHHTLLAAWQPVKLWWHSRQFLSSTHSMARMFLRVPFQFPSTAHLHTHAAHAHTCHPHNTHTYARTQTRAHSRMPGVCVAEHEAGSCAKQPCDALSHTHSTHRDIWQLVQCGQCGLCQIIGCEEVMLEVHHTYLTPGADGCGWLCC